jgi:uncharacterized protein with GYD domain
LQFFTSFVRREETMPKYLVAASYTADGVAGLVKDGGTGRRAKVTEAIERLGGSVEAFYFALGETDAYLILDLPDHETGTAISLAVNATGAVRVTTTVLLTPEQMDEATQKSVDYIPPGG